MRVAAYDSRRLRPGYRFVGACHTRRRIMLFLALRDAERLPTNTPLPGRRHLPHHTAVEDDDYMPPVYLMRHEVFYERRQYSHRFIFSAWERDASSMLCAMREMRIGTTT